MEKLVSVIVPIYNVEQYLSRCIDSILNQNYNNIEIIMVNDGSTDKSGEIADGYKRNDNKIRVIHKDNGGLSDARNCGLDNAQGQYVSFIDSDDYIHPDFIKTLLNICESNKCEISQCSFMYTTLSNQTVETRELSVKVFDNIQMLNRLYNETYINTVIACNKLYKRELFDNIRFPVGRIHEDEATTYKILYKASRIGVTDNELYFYYQNPDSIMHNQYSSKRLDILYAIEERKTFYYKNKMMDLFFKDNYRYLTKILINYYQIMHINEKESTVDKKQLLSELRTKYNSTLKESRLADWSLKRRMMLIFFRVIPSLYVPLIRPDQKQI